MSFLSGVGKFLKKAAPLAAFIPGVGPIAALGIGAAGGALGSALDHDNVLAGAAQGGLGAGVGKLAKGALPSLTGGGMDSASESADLLRSAGVDPGTIASLTGGQSGGGLGSLFKNPLDIAKLGIAGAGLISANKASSKGNKIADQLAADNAAQSADRTKLRGLFMNQVGGLPTARPDFGDLFASDNAFARRRAA